MKLSDGFGKPKEIQVKALFNGNEFGVSLKNWSVEIKNNKMVIKNLNKRVWGLEEIVINIKDED